MLVVTRLRAPAEGETAFRAGLELAYDVLRAAKGFLGGEIGRNIDEPDLWVLSTRWENVGSYRRAIGSYDAKLLVQPFMVHALDEPSAYEIAEPGADLNTPEPRHLG